MAPADGGGEQPHKAHRQHKSGAKARKKKGKGKGAAGDDAGGEQKNPKQQRPSVYKPGQQRLSNGDFMCQLWTAHLVKAGGYSSWRYV
nr:unnamed protein product [Digitaria exilis]